MNAADREAREGVRYVNQAFGRGAIVVHERWADRLIAALGHGAGCAPVSLGGRGSLYRVALDEGVSGLIRLFRRGGLLAPLLKNAYFLDNRPLREFDLLRALYAEGVAVPEPLGVYWWRKGGWYGGAIATRELAGQNLLDALHAPNADRRALLQKTGKLVRAVHDAGVWHADLQIKNVLVGERSLTLLDFDNARRGSISALQRARNLLRFRRSLLKHGFSESDFEAVMAGYGPLAIPAWLRTLYRLRDLGRAPGEGKTPR